MNGNRRLVRRLAPLLNLVALWAALPMLGCPDPDSDPNYDRCDIVPGSATETRALEMGEITYPAGVPFFVPFEEGASVTRVTGFQGSDMIASAYRIPALAGDGMAERCMQLTYRREGLEDASIRVRLSFERQGDYWVSTELFDELDGTGELTLEATAEDNLITASTSITVILVDP